MYIPDFLSFLFLIISFVYFLLAIRLFSLDVKSLQNQILFFALLLLAWWAFGFTLSNNASSFEVALQWRRLASIGWGVFYSVLLHYALILTNKKKLLQTKWIYALLYLPAVLNILIYGVLDSTVRASYNLIYTSAGWVNKTNFSIYDIPHFLSYIGFSIASLILIIYWGIKSTDKTDKIIALTLVCSGFGGLLLGTFTEHLLNAVFQIEFPQLGPLSLLIPAGALFYNVNRYGMLKPKRTIKQSKGYMLDTLAQDKIFLFLSISAFIGATSGFAALYFSGMASFNATMFITLVVMSAGLFVYILRKIDIDQDKKDIIVGSIIAIVLLVLTISLYEFTTANSWILPLLFVQIAVVFSNKKVIFFVGLSVVVSLAFVWIRAPYAIQTYTHIDHAIRVVIVSLMLGCSVLTNQIFKRAIVENREKLIKEKFLSETAAILMTVNEGNYKLKFKEIVGNLGKFMNSKKTDILFFDIYEETVREVFRYSKDDHFVEKFSRQEEKRIFEEVIAVDDLWINKGEGVYSFIKIEAPNKKFKSLNLDDTGSFEIIPLKSIYRPVGIMCIENVRTKAKAQEFKEFYAIAAQMLSETWIKLEAEEKIRADALIDSLTGVPNRLYFSNRLEQAISLAQRTNKFVGVCFLDVNSFKYINDTLGHASGDMLLQQIALRLKGVVREYDVIARFGGDEFLILIPQVDEVENIKALATRVMDSFETPLAIKSQNVIVTLSMGISVYPQDGERSDTLIKNADIAMYASKRISKNRFEFCSEELKEEAGLNAKLMNDLQFAIERGELFLNFQPQISLNGGGISGVETLLRWRHSEAGLVPPNVFIPLAEKSGQIIKIGEWVLHQACLQNKKWQSLGFDPMVIAINISLSQFMDENLYSIVKNALRDSGLNPLYLELEITENVAAMEIQSVCSKIDSLKELGVKISIDDFGKGFSSLDRFKSFAVDKIKIDMSFVHGVGMSKKDEEVIKVILQLGKTFGLKVLAEGVETESQLDFLKENFCDEVQGYFFFKPSTSDVVDEILKLPENQSSKKNKLGI